MAREVHELVQMAIKGDCEKMRIFIRQGAIGPESDKAQRALATAAEKNQLVCMQLLIEWGVSPNAAVGAPAGATALHWACRANQVESTQVLLNAKADFKVITDEGLTPMSVAVRQTPPRLEVVKVLLRAGAKVGVNDQCSGLAATVREVQLETMMTQLRTMSVESIDQDGINNANTEVWKAQREHMELLRTREQTKAGVQLVDLERRHANEVEEAKLCEQKEAELKQELRDKTAALEKTANELSRISHDLEEVMNSELAMRDEVDRVASELSDKKKELSNAVDEKAASEAQKLAAELARDEAAAETLRWEGEITEQERYNSEVRSELISARKELEDWMRDKKAAHALTEQAHMLLGATRRPSQQGEEQEPVQPKEPVKAPAKK